MRKVLVVIILSLVVIIVSCRKERNFSDNPSKNISLSTDTIAFDTVFTCVGSSTRVLMIYNNNSENLKINSIRLEQGSSSPYSINVDGQSGTMFKDMEIYANDSLYVFTLGNSCSTALCTRSAIPWASRREMSGFTAISRST